MTTTTKSMDSWDTVIPINGIGNYPAGMYYYFMGENDVREMSPIIGNCNAIHSCYLTPLISEEDLDINKIPYDTDRFGKLQGAYLTSTPQVKRVTNFKMLNKKLGEFDIYKINKVEGKFRHWSNESRLYNFPYAYSLLNDFINTPLEIHYHNILRKYTKENKFTISADAMISDKGTYSYWVDDYKGDIRGNMEAMVSTAPTDIPVSSSAYSNWSSTQKAQDNYNIQSNILQMGLANQTANRFSELSQQQSLMNGQLTDKSIGVNALGGLIGAGLSAITGNLGGAISGGMGSMMGSTIARQQNSMNTQFDIQRENIAMQQRNKQLSQSQALALGSKNAKLKDVSNTPRSLVNSGSDIGYSLKRGGSKLALQRYEITEEFKQRLGDYFALYGYRQAKLMGINLRSRHYYNYMKTVGANIKARTGSGIPKAHLIELMSIFDNGVTIWHVDRDKVNYLDYSMDNVEERRFGIE